MVDQNHNSSIQDIEHSPYYIAGARGVMVIVIGIGQGDTSSNLERD